ncbi:hypothetical protein SCP_0705170 [Sparassis crispa]|uniref:Uncharacterized protein n=1 Tax=Sparassis crispa TaxID=139825 RepID=A0A401GT34_9APHY|nr:hypothetical protein SCP_0705170 [Sparassis crispa]GBE85330.1 hypothetical protein SCP_0705170 [Sparassis crispa]
MHTTASVLLQTLADAGVTHAFVNWGNDHCAILEDLEQQRVERGDTALAIVTCPNEMVALSAAQAFAQVARRPAAVIVHVDVGTQALAGAVHNVDKGQTPVIIFAGASPFTVDGELKGSKNEWPMFPQDAPDQSAVVRQFMRFTGQIQSGKNAAKIIMRGFQFATSGPTGPVYLWARREILEEVVDQSAFLTKSQVAKWPCVEPSALSPLAARTISEALLDATFPMVITGTSGRNPGTVPLLADLSKFLAISVFDSCPQALNIPYSHPYLIGSSFEGRNPHLQHADVVLILDAVVPWIPETGTRLSNSARVFVIAADPLQRTTGYAHADAEMVCAADAEVALTQLLELTALAAKQVGEPYQERVQVRAIRAMGLHAEWLGALATAEKALSPNGTSPTAAFVLATLRNAVQAQTPSRGEKVLWLNEGISHCGHVWAHIKPEVPGNMIMSGGASLGWSLPAGVGSHLGAKATGKEYELITAVMGDGCFLFGIPSTSFWMARRYETPFLTIILNNGGWASPKHSMMSMHPDGHGSKASMRQLTVGFGPEMPDYAGIAAAAGGAWGRRVHAATELKATIEEAIRVVIDEKRSAVVDCIIDEI